MKYWLQILAILNDENGGSPTFSQKELNETGMSGDFVRAYRMIFSNIGVSAKILFSSNIENPKISALVKKVRRTVLLAVLTPLIIMFVLIFVTALMQ
jgi:hypothetical protein